jgi:topoisomerase-4 subunit B
MNDDLFASEAKAPQKGETYTAEDIEVLEGLEPVRRRPGMYIGGTDESAMHHLVSEVFDNAMDEAVAGYATRIEFELQADNTVIIRDNGRGIPIDPHPKFPKKSALEVILTTLHSGGKFGGKAYSTSGGLHGVGISVVNALSDKMSVEVVRDKVVYKQDYCRGAPLTTLEKIGTASNRRGTTITFHPDSEIFGTRHRFKAGRLYNLVRSKAYLFKGVEIRWNCDPALVTGRDDVPAEGVIHFPNGLQDFLKEELAGADTVTPDAFIGEATLPDGLGRVEWAMHWPVIQDGFAHYFCNTIVTPQGGTHEAGLKRALLKGVRDYGEMANNKKVAQVTAEDVVGDACTILSLFYREPQFQGQTKEKLVTAEVSKLVENAVKDHFDHWLTKNTEVANRLLAFLIQRAEERLSRRSQKVVSRKTVVQKLRLPGKLADCSSEQQEITEIFLVEGDSAGGSAKQARRRETQAVLPLRGKILNVANATVDKIKANQEINDIVTALGCGTGSHYDEDKLRYGKIIIMTDADVDGAHIASLLMTFFYKEMPQLIEKGHLFLAKPPLFRITQGTKTQYAHTDEEKDALVEGLSAGKGRVDVGRFKGLGEMTAPQLKETTMNIETRTLQRVGFADETIFEAGEHVDRLMGKKPELRYQFIQERSALLNEGLTENIDV